MFFPYKSVIDQLCYLGKDWIWGNQDEGAGNIGSVLVFQSSGAVLVRSMIQIMLKKYEIRITNMA